MNTEPKEPPPEAAIAEPMVDAAAVPPVPPDSAAAEGNASQAAQAPQTTDEPETAKAAPVSISPAECGARLSTLFPALFIAPGAPGPCKPIKLRIHADIQARAPGEFSKRVLGIFFSRYTTTNAYLKALAAPGAQRFDLDGAPAGEIAEEHRSAAAEEIARRQVIAAERRAMQRRAPPRDQAQTPDAPSGDAPADARPPRLPREQRPHQPQRNDRDARNEPRRDTRPPRRDAPPHRPAAHAQRPPRRDDNAAPRAPSQEHAPTPLPADPAQRERALLLRAFEASPLSKSNFCALKRISEADLDAALAQARSERP